ncbi:MAG: sugar phosphate nucleotidyltransferase [Alicyclobacillaceae bacterium]|nr:sugar phosphate nucleotidyltransferase [Alicyclobacillaceae bacterium]
MAVVMAGGRGMRLRPLTDILPKPLLPLDGIPVVEVLIRQLVRHGFDRITLAVGYGSPLLRTYLGDGRRLGARITYLEETRPLGTAGGLRRVRTEEPVLVVNGDILTTASFGEIFRRHGAKGADLTVVSRRSETSVEFGVLETEGDRVSGVAEKPRIPFWINAGIYVLSPSVLALIPEGPFPMTDLILAAIRAGKRVFHDPLEGIWIDIGRMEDLYAAERTFARQRNLFLFGVDTEPNEPGEGDPAQGRERP